MRRAMIKANSAVVLFLACSLGMPYARGSEEDERGCSASKTICNLTVTRSAQIASLFVSGDARIGGNETIAGDLTVNGCLLANCIVGNPVTQGNVHITGNLLVDGNIAAGGDVAVGGDLAVNGNTAVGGDLAVNGNTAVGGDLTVNGCLFADCFQGGGIFLDTLFSVVDATDQTKRVKFDVQGATGTTTTFITNPTTNRSVTYPNTTGSVIMLDTATEIVLMNQTAAFSSNAGIQYSGDIANRGQIRMNQFGNNAGVPGITGFKSRGTTIGSLAAVQVGDVIFRDTAIGVTGNNTNVPLSALISVNVTAVGSTYLGTEYELQLTPNNGPDQNARAVVFKVSGDGIVSVREGTNHMAGVATLGAAGTVTIANTSVPAANGRVMITVQPGPAPTGFVYVSNIIANTSFTITSTAGAGDAGVVVYYQIYQPTP